MHTRKGLFDSLAYGCIPVTFSPLTATNMYTWHWPEHYWKQIVIEIPLNESRSDKGIFYSDPVEYLYNLTLFNMSEIHERQKLLKARVFELQYALEENTALRGSSSSWPVGTVDGRPLKDAYMIAMDLVLGWNSGRASRGVANSTVFECWSGGVVVNNRCTKLDATLAPLANTIR